MRRERYPNEWDDHQIQTPSPSTPPPIDSPPQDIGGFHTLMEKAAKRFQLPMVTKQADCFLYDFKEQRDRFALFL